MEEIWRDINGYEGLYQVSTFGRVRSVTRVVPFTCRKTRKMVAAHKKGRVLAQPICGGYHTVCLYKSKKQGKRFKVSRLVAHAFVPNPLGKPYVNHMDGNKLNNHLENLEWATCAENIKHAYDKKLKKPYQNKKIICLDTGQIFDSATQAAKTFGVNRANISKAAKNKKCYSRGRPYTATTAAGHTWAYVEDKIKNKHTEE